VAKLLSELMLSEVTRFGRFDAIGSSDIVAMLGLERKRQMMGCADNSACLAEIGGALGADYLLTGQVGLLGTRYRVDLKLLDVKRARVMGREGDFAGQNEDALAAAVSTLVAKLLSSAFPGLAPPPPAPIAAVPPRPPAPEPAPSHALPYGLLGGAAVLALTGAGFGYAARSSYDDLASHKARDGDAYPAYYDANIGTLRTRENVANVAYGLSALTAGAGIFFLLRTPSPALAVIPASGGVMVSAGGVF
jgi:hypothetical protein